MKRRISILLCLAIIISALFTPISAVGSRDTSYEKSIAEDLKSLGLFKGVSETDFDLNRKPSRTEALVMLIRFLGKENEAMNGQWNHPFDDVVGWADKYVGYAYENGLTNGVSSTKFGSGSADAGMYLTFVLRALGYSDKNNEDFSWNNPYGLAKNAGILPERVDTSKFWRADVASVSYAALSASTKESNQTMADKLIEMGVFSKSQFELIYNNEPSINETNTTSTRRVLTPKEIYEECSGSVFYISTYDVDGNAYATGSGFFIDESGIAVTNYHVLENALSASVSLTNGSSYDIEGVIDYNQDMDYAIIKVAGHGFDTLEIGDSASVSGGDNIYAIGNPLGLTNSISDGIVSNPNRADINGMIQVTAPISSGSSGGALINVYGEVVGVTTASLMPGQNLNFAIPINSIVNNGDNKYLSSSIITMKEFAKRVTYDEFGEIPEAFDYWVDEIEPNNYYEDAQVIQNGASVWGILDDEYVDTFLVYCNTVGTIDLTMFSHSQPEFLKDLILAVEPVNNLGSEGVGSDYITFDDGTSARMLKYVIPRPGVYSINVLSNDLYNYYDLETDYSFYYTFTPGQTTGSNTGSRPLGDTSVRNPFESIVDYLLNYGTYDRSDNSYNLEMPVDYNLYSISYYPEDSQIVLGSMFILDNNEPLYTFIVFDELYKEYYYSVSLPSEYMEGTGFLTAKTFSPNTVLNFENYDGRYQDKSTFSQASVYSLCSLIEATEYMFRFYGIDTSIKELGFEHMYSIYSQ